MQKKIIALALAGLVSGAAFAQSNVTVYGIVDMYTAHGTASGAKSQNVINSGGLSGSRLGFKGTEDLGNGLKALFTLEYAVGADTNTGFLDGSANQARQQMVGLTGGFGTVVAGYLQTAGYDWAIKSSPVAGTALEGGGNLNNTMLLNGGRRGRAGNAFAYITPNFSGFSGAYNHARVTESTNANVTGKDATANLFAANYDNGPIGVAAVYSKISMDNTAASDDIKEFGLTGSYDLGMAKLSAAYQDHKVGDASRDKKYTLSAVAPVSSAGAAVFSFGKFKIASTVASDDAKAYTLAYLHNLSKRTTAYAGYTHTSNDSAAARSNALGIAPNAGGSTSLVAAGVRHSF